ncbi:MAG: hypothetical protein V1895_00790 [Parcubacteria group bacterium]
MSAKGLTRRFGKQTVAILVALGLLIGVSGVDLARPKQAQAIIPVLEDADIHRWIQFWQTEAQEITMDEVRRIVVQQVTKKMVEKILDELDVFVKKYKDYIYGEAGNDTLRYVDTMFDAFFASYIDPAVKNAVKQYYYGDYNPVPNDCVDPDSINLGDGNVLEKTLKYVQVGCNELSAQMIATEYAFRNYVSTTVSSQVELLVNKGLVKKDEKTDELGQSGEVYAAMIDGAMQAVFDVQTNNESALSSIIGAFVGQMLDEILDSEY